MEFFEQLDLGTILTLIIGLGILYGRIVRLETQVTDLKYDIRDFKKFCRAVNGVPLTGKCKV